ncbi:MAG: hypothetical protein PHR06_03935, partial [Candidatus Cloacimonetes bacterium]|nr:hypothetical protein [Candidatus Cloacimonadota bacterium]
GLIIGWLVLSFIVATIGRDRKIGYGNTLILSLLLSPIIGALFAIASQRNSEIKTYHRTFEAPTLHWEANYQAEEIDIDEELNTNERLFNFGAINETEYKTEKQRLEKLK